MAAQRIFLIDGTAFCYRAFHAIRGLATADGRPTNAVYGVAMMLKALRSHEHPDGLAFAFDTGKPTLRHEKFAEYKIQRKPMPDALISQIPVVKRLLSAYNIPVFEKEGYEGEDILASIAKRIAGGDVEVFLVTGDKDALQLVNSHTKVYNPHHKDRLVLDASAVHERYGIAPQQVVDLMALMGDDIDNIPGVPGVGEKTAMELMKQFGSVDELYRHLDRVEGDARRKALSGAQEQVLLSRELARIETDVPLTVNLGDIRLHEPDWRALRSLLREMEFKKLLSELDAVVDSAEQPSPVRLAEDCDVERCLEALSRGTEAVLCCWPSESGSSAVLAVAVAGQPVWVMRADSDAWQTARGRALFVWLADGKAPKIGHDLKLAMRWLMRQGLDVSGIQGDTMVAAYLLNPARTEQSLTDLADEYLQIRLPSPAAVDESPMLDQDGFFHPFAQAASAIGCLHERLSQALEKQQLVSLYTGLELPLVGVLARMEAAGIAIDRQHLAALSASMAARLNQLTETIHRLAGTAFNLNSPKQLAVVLFEQLKLPVIKRTKTGASTDADVLRQLAEKHPLPRQLLEYRELSKLVSTYVEALPRMSDAQGRVHTSFNQTATATGRLSSSEPNLQNIPVKTELGREIRKAFIAGIPDGLLVCADYSQIELRILAHLSGDEQLSEAFREGRDIHRYTASLIYNIPEAEVQPQQRSAMKAVNFGILYGMTSHGLSRELGMSFEEAQAFINSYFQRYPKVRVWLDSQIAKARKDGFVQTLLGRRRPIPEVNSPDMVLRQVGERMAINAPVQGTAADLIKRAMVAMEGELASAGLKSRMVLQVHDELVFECPRAELSKLAALARRVMEGAIALSVPLAVTIKAGPNWCDLSPVG